MHIKGKVKAHWRRTESRIHAKEQPSKNKFKASLKQRLGDWQCKLGGWQRCDGEHGVAVRQTAPGGRPTDNSSMRSEEMPHSPILKGTLNKEPVSKTKSSQTQIEQQAAQKQPKEQLVFVKQETETT